MKVVKTHGHIIQEIHSSRKKRDPKIMGLGLEVEAIFKGKVGQYYNSDTGELREAVLADKITAGFCKENINKAELISKLSADELTDILTKKASNPAIEAYWLKGDNGNVTLDILIEEKIIDEVRAEEILTIIK